MGLSRQHLFIHTGHEFFGLLLTAVLFCGLGEKLWAIGSQEMDDEENLSAISRFGFKLNLFTIIFDTK